MLLPRSATAITRRRAAAITVAVLAAVLFGLIIASSVGTDHGRRGVLPRHRNQVFVKAGGSDATCRVNNPSKPCLTTTKACTLARVGYFIVQYSPYSRTSYASLCVASTTPNVYVATSGNDSTCVRNDNTKPCATLSKGYLIASPGDLIQVAAGTYTGMGNTASCAFGGDTCIRITSARSSPAVTMQPAPAATVNVTGSWDFEGVQYLTLDGLHRWNFSGGAMGIVPTGASACSGGSGVNPSNIIMRNYSMKGPFTIRSATNITIQNADIGSFSYPDGGTQDAWGDSSRVGAYTGCITPSNITLDNVHFHDIYRGDSSSHAECFFGAESTNVSIRNSYFDHCPVYGILWQGDPAIGYQNWTVENNIFTPPCPNYNAASKPANVVTPAGGQTDCGSTALNDAQGNNGNVLIHDLVIRFNTFQGGPNSFLAQMPAADWNSTDKLYGNLGGQVSGPCASNAPPANMANWTIGYNAWLSAKCASTDITTTDAANFGPSPFKLIAGAPAIDLVPTGQGCPATDYEGTTRPQGPACDAGYDER